MTMITLDNKYSKNLPFEIIQLIMSYARSPQPKKLLNDIENFYETRSFAFDVYYKEWIIQWDEDSLQDKYWFVNDIILFANGYQATKSGYIDDFYKIFFRNPRIVDCEKVVNYVKNIEKKAIESQLNILWGMLKPKERKKMLKESLAAILNDLDNE